MEGEWLAKVEVVEAMGAISGDQSWMEKLTATRGFKPVCWRGGGMNWALGGSGSLSGTEESVKR